MYAVPVVIHCLSIGGGVTSSPARPSFQDETDAILGNHNDVLIDEEEDGEELFGDNFERCARLYICT